MKKIDFLAGDNHYSTTMFFAKKFREALVRKGCLSRFFWIGDGDFFRALHAISADPPDLTCSFADITINGASLGEFWTIPHLSLLVDPAIYFLHHCKGSLAWMSCIDQDDCELLRSLQFPRGFFLPHAIENESWTHPEAERSIDVAFFGTCIDFDSVQTEWREKYSQKTQNLLASASQRVLSPEEVSIFRALAEEGVGEKELPMLHYEVDRYIRGRERVELIQHLKGFQVHVWGAGAWKKFVPWAHLHPPVLFPGPLQRMEGVKVVLSSSPRFKRGLHERILYALQRGAAVVTGGNSLIKAEFDGAGVLTYRYGMWEEAREHVQSLLKDEQARQKLVLSGQEIVRRSHTWDARADLLLTRFTQKMSK